MFAGDVWVPDPHVKEVALRLRQSFLSLWLRLVAMVLAFLILPTLHALTLWTLRPTGVALWVAAAWGGWLTYRAYRAVPEGIRLATRGARLLLTRDPEDFLDRWGRGV